MFIGTMVTDRSVMTYLESMIGRERRSMCGLSYLFCFSALIDACEAVRLAPTWAKGYLRKGRALYGLKVSMCTHACNIFQSWYF